jgi:hypothetical protein
LTLAVGEENFEKPGLVPVNQAVRRFVGVKQCELLFNGLSRNKEVKNTDNVIPIVGMIHAYLLRIISRIEASR